MKRRSRERWRVLLAEDNDDHALLIQMALERASNLPLELRRARNGNEAVSLMEESVPDLLLLDLKMPGRSGHEVLEFVKGRDDLKGTPIAVLTSSDRDEDMARAYGLGGNHFLTKPEDPAQLEARLRALLKNLDELSGISRGAQGIPATARSALTQGHLQTRNLVAFASVFVVVVALLVYGWLAGVIP